MLIQVNIRRVKKLGVAVLKKCAWFGHNSPKALLFEITLHFITLRFAGPLYYYFPIVSDCRILSIQPGGEGLFISGPFEGGAYSFQDLLRGGLIGEGGA